MKWLAAFALASGIVMLIRLFCIESYRISTDSMEEALHKGDYILVNKIPGKNKPVRGKVVLFTSPLSRDSADAPLFISRCIGMPGDTIRVSMDGYTINGQKIPRSPRSLCSYFITLSARETDGKASFRDGKLYLDGRETNFFFFRQDYYWVLSDNTNEAVDSRHLGFIPADHIVGNAWLCWYSPDKQRIFKPVH